MRIMIVDDSKAVHKYLSDCFSGTEHEVTHAYDGAEAFSKLEKDAVGYGVILLDWEMPVMTGPELLAKLRASKNQTPVVMMTTKSSTSDIAEMLKQGAQEYMMKPFTQDIVFEKIKAVTGLSV